MKQIYVFTKSGNKVTIIQGSESKVRSNPKCAFIDCVDVERVDSKKQMTVPVRSLVKVEDYLGFKD